MPSDYFRDDTVTKWERVVARQTLRDRWFLQGLEPYFRPGAILELGAAVGHMSQILHERGHDITASDFSPAFVAAAASRGLDAKVVDATRDIFQQAGRQYANILAQNISPLNLRDETRVRATLTNIHGALEPEGRFIAITAHPRDRAKHFTPREQRAIAQSLALFHVIRTFPHQVMPPTLYRPWSAPALNALDHVLAHIAAVRLVWILQKK